MFSAGGHLRWERQAEPAGLQPLPLPSSLGWRWGLQSLWKGGLDPEGGFNQS